MCLLSFFIIVCLKHASLLLFPKIKQILNKRVIFTKCRIYSTYQNHLALPAYTTTVTLHQACGKASYSVCTTSACMTAYEGLSYK